MSFNQTPPPTLPYPSNGPSSAQFRDSTVESGLDPLSGDQAFSTGVSAVGWGWGGSVCYPDHGIENAEENGHAFYAMSLKSGLPDVFTTGNWPSKLWGRSDRDIPFPAADDPTGSSRDTVVCEKEANKDTYQAHNDWVKRPSGLGGFFRWPC